MAFDGGHSIFEMKHDPVFLVQRTNEITHIGTEDALHRPLFRRHHVYFDLACARLLPPSPIKLCTDHERARRTPLAVLMIARAISERA